LAGRFVTECDAVTDDDPCVAETVVVAVDGEQGPDVLRDRSRVLDDVGSETVLREGVAQGGDVGAGAGVDDAPTGGDAKKIRTRRTRL